METRSICPLFVFQKNNIFSRLLLITLAHNFTCMYHRKKYDHRLWNRGAAYLFLVITTVIFLALCFNALPATIAAAATTASTESNAGNQQEALQSVSFEDDNIADHIILRKQSRAAVSGGISDNDLVTGVDSHAYQQPDDTRWVRPAYYRHLFRYYLF